MPVEFAVAEMMGDEEASAHPGALSFPPFGLQGHG